MAKGDSSHPKRMGRTGVLQDLRFHHTATQPASSLPGVSVSLDVARVLYPQLPTPPPPTRFIWVNFSLDTVRIDEAALPHLFELPDLPIRHLTINSPVPNHGAFPSFAAYQRVLEYMASAAPCHLFG